MTRDEWYKSPQFLTLRFLNNTAAQITYQAQQVGDVLDLLLSQYPDLFAGDPFSLAELQLRVVKLEASKLWDRIRNLERRLAPLMGKPSFEEMTDPKPDARGGVLSKE